jgi:SPP1 gp7 family putative phage head morphogenesis protein
MASRKSNAKNNLIVSSIIIRPNSRSVLDVGQWRTALKAADRGKRQRLYDLYDDILLDGVLWSAIDKRIKAITNAELVFKTKDEKMRSEMDDLMESTEWEYMLIEIMKTIFYGKSIIELDFSEGFRCWSIPRQHINTAKKVITVNPNDEDGFPYENNDFLLNVGRDDDLGVLLKAAPYAIYKRGGFGDWSQFVELFGMPRRIGKYSSHDDTSRKLLEEALEQAGSASWMVVPKETDVETQTTSASQGSTSVYKEFRDACNEEILITILGQTMTTEDGSSRSQSETHKEVEEAINRSDRRFVQRVLNHLLLPRLAKRGYPVDGGYFYFPEAGESISIKDQLDMDVRLVNELGIALDDDYFYETYGRPKPRRVKSQPSEGDSNHSWLNRMLSFFAGAPSKGATVNHPTCSGCGGTHHINLADGLDAFDTDALLNRIAEGASSYFDAGLFQYTSGTLINALNAGFLAKSFTDYEYGFEPDALKTAMEINLFHFSAAKTLTEVQRLNELWRESKSFEEFRAKAEGVTRVFNQNWLRAEYDTAYHVAENSATYYRLIRQADIYPYWEYRTVGDSKVREEHAALNGVVLPANDKHWRRIYPPNGWNCRCYVVPRMKHEVQGVNIAEQRKSVEAYLQTPEWKKNAAQGFDVNRALLAEVFLKNQMYIRKFPTMANKYLDKLTAERWGLPPISSYVKKATHSIPITSESEVVIWNSMSRADEITLTDYKGRSIILTRKQFITHTTAKGKDNRIRLWNAMLETISSPDEVWLNNMGPTSVEKSYSNYNLIKYYSDGVIVVNYAISKGRLFLKTWYMLPNANVIDNPKKLWDSKRHGLLIKKPDN